MIKGYPFEEVEFPRPGIHRAVLASDIVDGRQTNAELRGLAYVFKSCSEITGFRLSVGPAYEKDATVIYLEGTNLETLWQQPGATHPFKGNRN